MNSAFISDRDKIEKIPVCRKNCFVEYVGSSLLGGGVLAVFVFLFAVIFCPLVDSIIFAFCIFVFVFLTFSLIGFISEEIINRKKRIEYIQSEKYNFLYECGLEIHEDLFFEGVFDGYSVRVIPTEKWESHKEKWKYDYIEAFYTAGEEVNLLKLETFLTGNYNIGNLYFQNKVVGFIPNDWKQPDFEKNFKGVISILKRYNLKPYSLSDWNNTIGKQVKEKEAKEVKSRNLQLMKFWEK